MLTRVAQDAERAVRAVEAADGLLGDEGVTEAVKLLRELLGQDFDIDADGVPRLHQGTRARPDRVGCRSGDAPRPQEPADSGLTATSCTPPPPTPTRRC